MDQGKWSDVIASSLLHHQVVLVGLGREGWSSYRFIRQILPEVEIFLIDDMPQENLSANWQEVLKHDRVTFLTSELALRHTSSWVTPETMVIKTPGLPLHHPLSTFIHRQDLLLSSNTDLLYQVLDLLPQDRVKTIAITGTKGKSTTTSFIYHLLQTANLPTLIAGNIGVPPLDILPDLTTYLDKSISSPIWVVLEQSCHQLDDLRRSPDIAVIQHIVPEHLDYYPDFDRYLSAKASIARFQTATDLVIASSHSPTATQLAQRSPGSKLDSNPDVWVRDSQLIWRATQDPLCSLADLPLKGSHNVENISPGLVLAEYLHISPQTVEKALLSFQPLPHRLQSIGIVDGVEYINDSLATVPEAAVAALSAFAKHPTVLLAGGYDRHQDFTPLADWILTHGLRGLILFPPTGQRLLATLTLLANQRQLHLPEIVPNLSEVEHMAEAVQMAHQWTKPQDVVLLSPASASFGEFKDYADRGQQFAKQVQLLQSSTAV